MRLVAVSDGGIGEFLFHLDALRIYRNFREIDLTICATANKIVLGREILEDVSWTETQSFGLEGRFLAEYDGVIAMRWFTEFKSDLHADGELVVDLNLYKSFDAARALQHLSLRQKYDSGLTLHSMILNSSGLQSDGNFIYWDGPSDNSISGEYILACNDCDPTPCKSQTKQVPAIVWRDVIEELLESHRVVEVGVRAVAPSTSKAGYLNLTGRTSVLEWASLIRHARRIVTIEGGTAHLAAVLRRPATVICGPTDARAYGHSLHTYVSSGVCNPCHWTTQRWFEICPLGDSRACMHGLDPHRIVERIVTIDTSNL